MDVKLEGLIEKIKKDGIEEANSQSENIIKDAEKEAEKIINDSKKEAEKIINGAKKQAEMFEENSKQAVKQAARDIELVLKERVLKLFDRVFKKEAGKALDAEFVKELITRIADKWSGGSDIDIVTSPEDEKKIKDTLFAGVKDELKTGVTIRPAANISKGFRIGLKGENVYYDFTDESISEILRGFVNPSLRELLEK